MQIEIPLLQKLGIKFLLLHICTSVLQFLQNKRNWMPILQHMWGSFWKLCLKKIKWKESEYFFSLFFFTEYQRFTLQQSYLSFEDTFIRISYIFLIYIIKLIKCCIKSLTFLKKKFKLNRLQAEGTFQLSGLAVDCLCINIGIIKIIANFLRTQESVQIKIWCTVKYMYV